MLVAIQGEYYYSFLSLVSPIPFYFFLYPYSIPLIPAPEYSTHAALRLFCSRAIPFLAHYIDLETISYLSVLGFVQRLVVGWCSIIFTL